MPESTSGAPGTMEDADRSPDAAQDVDMGTAMVRPGRVERVESSSDLPVERAITLHIFDGRERSTPRSTGCPRRALVSTPFHHTR